ncbi:MAG: tetratricopeptide repeat protein, partial [bacterium]|nr:tetratricopeptide repeat protein [bacterium]
IHKCAVNTDKNKLVNDRLNKAKDLAQKSQYSDAVSEVKLVLVMDKENKQAKDKLLEYETSLNKQKAASEPQNNLDLAYNYFSAGSYNNAKETVNSILEKDGNNVKAKKLLDMIEEKEVEGDLEKINRKKIMELYSQGVTLYVNQDYDGCLKTMKTIVEIDPDNMQALKFIDKAKAKISEKTESQTARTLTPASKKLVWECYLKGINFYQNDELEKAINEWKQALKLDPTNSKIKGVLDKAYKKREMLEYYK